MFGSLRDRMISASYRSRTAWSCRASTLGSAVVASPTTVVVVLVGTTVVVVVTTTRVVVVSGNEDPAEPPSDELQLARASTAAIPPAAVRRSRIRRTLRNRPHARTGTRGSRRKRARRIVSASVVRGAPADPNAPTRRRAPRPATAAAP